jgi:CheY-like chemotaxis protein
MNILLLDDNSHRIAYFQSALKGHKVVVCRHARTAIHALKESPFDVIFLDHDLRGEPADPDDENCGSEVARFIADRDIPCKQIILHTENRIGRESMETILPQSQSIPYSKLKKIGLHTIVKSIPSDEELPSMSDDASA